MFIPYVIERSSNGERSYDIYSRLLKDRIIILSGEIDDLMASSITAQLLFLAAEDSELIHLVDQLLLVWLFTTQFNLSSQLSVQFVSVWLRAWVLFFLRAELKERDLPFLIAKL